MISMISEAWRRVYKDRSCVKRNIGFDIYKEDYWKMTKEILTDQEIGYNRKNKEITKKFNLKENNARIIYADESRAEEDSTTGAAIVEEEEDEDFYFSVEKKCSIYTVEAVAIAKAIHKNENTKDMIIYTDSRSCHGN